MGKGFGSINYWVFPVKRNTTICSLDSLIQKKEAMLILKQIKSKLNINTKIHNDT
jgi:ribosomal protein L16/L10AE